MPDTMYEPIAPAWPSRSSAYIVRNVSTTSRVAALKPLVSSGISGRRSAISRARTAIRSASGSSS